MTNSENIIQILLDDVVFFERENTQEIPYDNLHYLLLNIAMGGNLGGSIPSNFSESIMEIDYVRVYEESSLSSQNPSLEQLAIYPNPSDYFYCNKYDRRYLWSTSIYL